MILLFCFFLQLRSSFKQAFSKKKTNKSQSSHDEIEEMTDSSLPSSPKLQHTDRQTSTTQPLRSSPSTTEWVQTHIQYMRIHLYEIYSRCLNMHIFVVLISFVCISVTLLHINGHNTFNTFTFHLCFIGCFVVFFALFLFW